MKGHIQYNIQYNCIGHIYIFCLYLYLYLYLHLYRLELRAVEQLDIWIGTHGNSPSPLQYIQNSEYRATLILVFQFTRVSLSMIAIIPPKCFDAFWNLFAISHNFIFLFLHPGLFSSNSLSSQSSSSALSS